MATAAAGPPGDGTPQQWGGWTNTPAQATPDAAAGQTPAPGDAAPQASPAQPTVGDGAPADQHPASTTPEPTAAVPKRPPPVLHRPPRPRSPGADAAAEIMRKALAERHPVAPDAIVHSAPEVCIDPGSGNVLTPAQVLQSLVDDGRIKADDEIWKCLERHSWNRKFRISPAMVVHPEDGFTCWAGLLQGYDLTDRALQEFALLASNAPAGQAEASKILHNLMRHSGNWTTDATGWVRGSIQDSNIYLHEWRAHEGTRPPARTFADLRIPEAEVEEPWRGRTDRDAWAEWKPNKSGWK